MFVNNVDRPSHKIAFLNNINDYLDIEIYFHVIFAIKRFSEKIISRHIREGMTGAIFINVMYAIMFSVTWQH